MKKKIYIVIILSCLLLITPLILAYDYSLICLKKGETIKFSECNPLIDDRTCGSNLGCQFCAIKISDGVYCPANLNKCYALKLSCSYLTDAQIDRQPPQLEINSPIQNKLYTSNSILMNIDVNEKSNIFYYDNLNGISWKQVCIGCFEYNRPRLFKEGLNDLTFKASDVLGNTAYQNVSFYVDSKKPKIRNVEPRRGFAPDNFKVYFSEENPKSLKLYYGNYLRGYTEKDVNIEDDCYKDKGKYICDTNVDVSDYDGQFINYWFNITDIANNSDKNKPVSLNVDVSEPVINNLNYTINARYVTFNINVTEINFDEISYIDWSSARPVWRRLCTRLRNNICINKKSFSLGNHDLTIQVTDEAGNSVGRNINFNIV